MSPQLLAYLMLESSVDTLGGPTGFPAPENEARVDSILDAMDRLWWDKMSIQDIETYDPEIAEVIRGEKT